jgi:hypothetical protein
MSRNRRTVHIPIVQPGGGAGGRGASEDRLIEVYTQIQGFDPMTREEEEQSRAVDAKARDKDWDRVAAPLRKVGLYQAGCAAASAVRKLGIAQPLTALYQRISRLAWIEGQRLHPATAQGPSEGRSAELGLALVMLMCASGSRHRQVIATGALGGQPPRVSEDDVEILPVGSLPEKLRLVATLARHGGLPQFDAKKELLFFTPRRFQQDGEWEEVAALPEVAQLKEFGVRVVPVDRLSEAAAAVDARRARHLARDRLAQALLIGACLISGIGVAWSVIPPPRVPITFLPAGGLALDAEPYQACFTDDGGFYPIPLERDGIARSIPVGETLGWRVQIGQPPTEADSWQRWFAPKEYHIAQVMLSEHSRAKIIVPAMVGGDAVRVPPGGIWEWGWKLNDRVENNGLVLLAQPDLPIDPDALRAALVAQFPNAAGSNQNDVGLDITAAANFVAKQAPGAATFVIQTVERTARCTP